ncbi:MAG TPA: polysaccharide deacetylase family protein [Steroidobacteraceae bacterium]|jgi:peptidoglycan/xylan/chitin deacetylase (PgdA/CDA1 family)
MKLLLRKVMVAGLANRASAALLKPLWDGRASVFMLHRQYHPERALDGTTNECIAGTIQALRRAGARMVSLRYLFECASQGRDPEPGCVAFTIDDGYLDQGLLAREFLRHDCSATIFLVSGFIDRQLWPWDEQLAFSVLNSKTTSLQLPEVPGPISLDSLGQRHTAIDQLQQYCKTIPWSQVQPFLDRLWSHLESRPPDNPPEGHRPLSWDEIRELEAAGIDFAPHSVTHRVASQLSSAQSREEITTSWNRLQSELRTPLPVYAWPTGRTVDFGPRETQLARELGLMGAVSTNDAYADFGRVQRTASDIFRIDRFAFAQNIDVNLQYGTAIERLKQKARTFLQ